MSRVCAIEYACRFKPQQTDAGCPCADLCPGFVPEDERLYYSSGIDQSKTKGESDVYDTLCSFCFNSRFIVSENGLKPICTLSDKKAIRCIVSHEYFIKHPCR